MLTYDEIYKRRERYPAYRLQFFADEGGDKTEEPTAKKLSDARKEGQVAKSMELVTATMLLAMFVMLKVVVGYIGTQFIEGFTKIYPLFGEMISDDFSRITATALLQDALLDVALISLPIFVAAVVVSFAINVAQVKWQITTKPLKPKGSKLNPVNGMKRIFSKDKLFELVRDSFKIIFIFIIAYTSLKNETDLLTLLYDFSLEQAVVLIGDMVIDLGIKISAFYFVIGLADYIYQKLKFKRDLRMTKQEIKDEYKQQEGDPQIKGKIKSKMREASQRRMMQQLPEADVVITNPTHFACAIKYDKDTAEAPVLIAKGADYVAQKIKEVAKEHDIPIVENKPLARMLYYNVDLDKEIPKELYQMTAEVLAYVYKLKNKL